jgi:hypothetical protein
MTSSLDYSDLVEGCDGLPAIAIAGADRVVAFPARVVAKASAR